MSYVAFAPGRGVGVFVAVNRVDFAMSSALTGAANNLIVELATRSSPVGARGDEFI